MGFLKKLFHIEENNSDSKKGQENEKRSGIKNSDAEGKEPSVKMEVEERADSEKTTDELKEEAEKYRMKVQRTASYLERALREGNLKDAEKFQEKMEAQETRLAEIEAEWKKRNPICRD